PPHRINYRANISALHQLGVKRIISTNAVGAINFDMMPGDIVIPHDFVDFCRLRPVTFYDEKPVHVDMSQPYCPEIRSVLEKQAKASGVKTWDKAVLVCTEKLTKDEQWKEIKDNTLFICDSNLRFKEVQL
ncbi:MAG: hypothetical protein K6T54_09350, partial [Ignavibacterium sp.]|nr:hypothetical protein [Ignavibacterium sp.]